jgi:hypothetical protein
LTTPSHFSFNDCGYGSPADPTEVASEDTEHRAIIDCPEHAITVLHEWLASDTRIAILWRGPSGFIAPGLTSPYAVP